MYALFSNYIIIRDFYCLVLLVMINKDLDHDLKNKSIRVHINTFFFLYKNVYLIDLSLFVTKYISILFNIYFLYVIY